MDFDVIQTLIVNQLKDLKFFVPSYQRGYRWTEFEVEALLDDIYNFDNKNGKAQYCIQPLIVQKCEDGKWEVVDGQQRLTTIFIILKAIKKFLPQVSANFSLEYKTRSKSETGSGSWDFLNNVDNKSDKEANENIDFYYMFQAYQTIIKWANNKEKASNNIMTVPDVMTDLNKNLGRYTFFIWYPLEQGVASIDMFSKVNVGKIPLTDGELIKALLLNSNSFEDDERISRQTEISVSWDRIEQDLHHDSLWYFFNDYEENRTIETRIDIIFDLLAKEYNEEFKSNINKETPHFSFVVMSHVLNSGKKDAIHIWKDVELQYEKLKSWYEDYNLYHLIGFLLSIKNKNSNSAYKVADIKDLTDKKGKKQTLKSLLDEILKQINNGQEGLITKENDKVKVDLNLIDYDKNQKKAIRNILLLFNIASLICFGDRQLRFSFELYKKEKWDIEHIHATADQSADPDNSMGNLTLLAPKINRTIQDNPFNIKRNKVIEFEKEGSFIPLCSKNIYLRYYTDKAVVGSEKYDDTIWNEEDKKYYVEEMQKVFQEFFKAEWISKIGGERK